MLKLKKYSGKDNCHQVRARDVIIGANEESTSQVCQGTVKEKRPPEFDNLPWYSTIAYKSC